VPEESNEPQYNQPLERYSNLRIPRYAAEILIKMDRCRVQTNVLWKTFESTDIEMNMMEEIAKRGIS
jgi:hypothetical protein